MPEETQDAWDLALNQSKAASCAPNGIHIQWQECKDAVERSDNRVAKLEEASATAQDNLKKEKATDSQYMSELKELTLNSKENINESEHDAGA